LTSGSVHIVGTHTFAGEVADFAREAGLSIAGLLETGDPGRIGMTVQGLPVMPLEEGPGGEAEVQVIIGTGEPRRREVVARAQRAGWEPVSLVHPEAHLAASVSIGPGVLIAPGVVVGAYTTIGEHVVMGRGTLVGHHVEIGEFATLGPGVNLAGGVRIEPDTFFGMGAVVRDHVSIGAGAIVAMGAVVIGDVAPEAEVRGVPACAAPRWRSALRRRIPSSRRIFRRW
jgi:sugar O-acyltransferase (sialic acid O-acetyltransferase NeuD family)